MLNCLVTDLFLEIFERQDFSSKISARGIKFLHTFCCPKIAFSFYKMALKMFCNNNTFFTIFVLLSNTLLHPISRIFSSDSSFETVIIRVLQICPNNCGGNISTAELINNNFKAFKTYFISSKCLFAMANKWKYIISMMAHGRKKDTIEEVMEYMGLKSSWH